MGAIAFLALGTGRSRRSLAALAAAVLGLLLVDPWLARSYGFALSVLATGGLVLLAPGWARPWTARGLPRPWPRRWPCRLRRSWRARPSWCCSAAR